MPRPVIASSANTTKEKWRSVAVDKCGAKNCKKCYNFWHGECPFDDILWFYTIGHLPYLFNYFGEGIVITRRIYTIFVEIS